MEVDRHVRPRELSGRWVVVVPIGSKVGLFQRRARNHTVMEVRENSMRDAMPFLPCGLISHARRQVVHTRPDALKKLRADGLPLEGIATVIPRCFTLCSLGKFAESLPVRRICHPLSTQLARASLVVVRRFHEWNSKVWSRVCEFERKSTANKRVVLLCHWHRRLPMTLPMAFMRPETRSASFFARPRHTTIGLSIHSFVIGKYVLADTALAFLIRF